MGVIAVAPVRGAQLRQIDCDVDTLKLPMRQCHEFWLDDPMANKVRACRLSGDPAGDEFAAVVTMHRWENVHADSDDRSF